MHIPKKRFGQNFLDDQNIIDKIIRSINPKLGQTLVEIGPGLGAITRPLLSLTDSLNVIEIDHGLVDQLQLIDDPNLKIFDADALSFDFSQFYRESDNCKFRVIGNLPYNISTPLLFYLFKYINQIEDMHFMLQKELVDRICAAPHNKTYGRLSVIIQSSCNVEKLFNVPATSFTPPPKVESAIIRIIPKVNVELRPNSLDLVVRTAFSKRRKTLRNNLKDIMSSEDLEQSPVDLKLRAENISVAEFINLAKWYDTL